MPYIVTTKRPFEWDGKTLWAISRVAVATLEDPPNSTESGVRGLLYAMVPEETNAHEHDDLYEQIDAIGEPGGTITLPDGTVIEVEPVSYDELTRRADVVPLGGFEDRHAIAAYNARWT